MSKSAVLKKSVLGLMLVYVFAIGAIWLDGYTSGYENAEYAVVLGNQVFPSGEPSPRLKARLLRAKTLYDEGVVSRILVSGGFGKEGHDEATVMRQFLEQNGIPSEHIQVDSCGHNTRFTAQNSLRWLKGNQQSPVIVVSQLYHLSRTKMAFRQLGFERVGGAWPDFFERRDIYASIREVLAWLKYWVVY